jgi:hypothetical protein
VYRQIGLQVLSMGPEGMDRRTSTSASTKLALVAKGGLIAARAVTLDGWRGEPQRPPLWTPL